MHDDDDDAEQREACRRNAALVASVQTRIPSYALWTADAVGAPGEWPRWWASFEGRAAALKSTNKKGGAGRPPVGPRALRGALDVPPMRLPAPAPAPR